ncbi:Z1 domain-containing protein [Streptomyces diacarni]|uniref:Z1 domain-containing protein n=1 Tax=Streptomyces diacarni TaxID=2800381 RepID=UPI0033C2E780
MSLNTRQSDFKTYLKNHLFDPVAPLKFEDLEAKGVKFAELLFPDLSALDVEAVIQELTVENEVTMPDGDSIVDAKTFKTWIAARKVSTETKRWDAYKQLLINRDWEANVVRTLDVQTDDVVELLGDPYEIKSNWPRRGLLLGDVQSGKTATYLGILNKALDYGYRVVIVIGGHTEDLRQQTQARFDTDLLGVDSETLGAGISDAAIRYVGIGKISGLRSHLMTTVRDDFSKSKADSGVTWVDGGIPTVFVTKKNAALINNIRKYIKDQAPGGRLDIPLVVIDDESDWGSPNTKNEADPTGVNKAIRTLLDVSTRSTYLAITATPFANIFINDQAKFNFIEQTESSQGILDNSGTVLNDLFPSDYIRVMKPPNTYSGIGTYFPVGGHAAIDTCVDDCIDILPIKHKNHHPVTELPNSMKTGILEFLLGTAVRRIRDSKIKPASMLINVSRFKSVQREVFDLVDTLLKDIVSAIISEFKRSSPLQSDISVAMKSTWESRYSNVSDVDWIAVSNKLFEIAQEFRVELINGDTAKMRVARRKLMSSNERKDDDLVPKIIVGGDVLSRGLTLEGLQVSYFVREPRTMDTLMQMGRWFGYRPGYEDLVRIWMPESTRMTFQHSAEVMEELRYTLLDMKARGLTPRDFGLRILLHPESVNIVAANKGKDTETIEVGPSIWENRLAESFDLTNDESVELLNREAVNFLLDELTNYPSTKSNAGFSMWNNVNLAVIERFFKSYQGHSGSQWFAKGPNGSLRIADSFENSPGNNRWDVVFVNTGKGEKHKFSSELSVPMSVRNKMGIGNSGNIRLDRRRVATGNDVVGALSVEDKATFNARSNQSEHAQRSSQARALSVIDHPILMIYVVTAVDPKKPDESDLGIVDPGTKRIAVTIAFPPMTQEQILEASRDLKTYQVNQVYWRAYNGFIEQDGDDVYEEEML